jgi:hypothetical protein
MADRPDSGTARMLAGAIVIGDSSLLVKAQGASKTEMIRVENNRSLLETGRYPSPLPRGRNPKLKKAWNATFRAFTPVPRYRLRPPLGDTSRGGHICKRACTPGGV